MYIGFKHLHSFSAYLTLAFLIIAIVMAIYSVRKNLTFSSKNKTIAILALVGTHLQMVFGLVLYFVSPLGISNFSGEMMKNSTSRLYGLEHPMMMLIAIILITIGYSKSKKATEDRLKFKNIAIYFSIGLVFILSRIPWSAWWG